MLRRHRVRFEPVVVFCKAIHFGESLATTKEYVRGDLLYAQAHEVRSVEGLPFEWRFIFFFDVFVVFIGVFAFSPDFAGRSIGSI